MEVVIEGEGSVCLVSSLVKNGHTKCLLQVAGEC